MTNVLGCEVTEGGDELIMPQSKLRALEHAFCFAACFDGPLPSAEIAAVSVMLRLPADESTADDDEEEERTDFEIGRKGEVEEGRSGGTETSSSSELSPTETSAR